MLDPQSQRSLIDVLPRPGPGRADDDSHPAGEELRVDLLIGPEGGFIPFELELFRECGFEFVGLGARILRVETAVVALLGQQALAADAC